MICSCTTVHGWRSLNAWSRWQNITYLTFITRWMGKVCAYIGHPFPFNFCSIRLFALLYWDDFNFMFFYLSLACPAISPISVQYTPLSPYCSYCFWSALLYCQTTFHPVCLHDLYFISKISTHFIEKGNTVNFLNWAASCRNGRVKIKTWIYLFIYFLGIAMFYYYS